MVLDNLLSPAVLFFVLGLVAAIVKSDLKFPSALSESLSIYLLAAIGLKGGIEISKYSFSDLMNPLIGAMVLGAIIPVVMFWICTRLRFDFSQAAALAATYGSVSIVTFGAGMAFLEELAIPFESYMTALVVVMESPAIFIALMIYFARQKQSESPAETKNRSPYALGIIATQVNPFPKGSFGHILRESIFGKSVLLMIGAMIVGMVGGKDALPVVKPLFIDLYPSILMIFLLGMGLVAGERIGDLRKFGWKSFALATTAPLVFGILGVIIGYACGMSVGGTTLLGVLGASASYIAAPAAIKQSIPEANPAIYLGMSLGMTFPFNLIIGIPIYMQIAIWIHN